MAGSGPSVSVVIPTRNRPELLVAAVRSVVAQDYRPIEIVVVDEGSAPAAAAALKGEGSGCLRILRNETPAGVASARNRGAAAATGEFLAFLDDDDVFLSSHLTSLVSAVLMHPEAGVVFGRRNGRPAANGTERFSGKRTNRLILDPTRYLLENQAPHIDGVLVRRREHEKVLFDEQFRACEDLDYLLRLSLCTRFVAVDRLVAVPQRTEGPASEINLELRIEYRKRYREKHARLFDRKAEAFHRLRLGHLYLRKNERGRSRQLFFESMRHRPSLRALKGFLRTLL